MRQSPQTQTRKILAQLAPDSADDETQTVDATLASAAGVKSRDARGVYIEFIDIDGSTVADGAPLLDSHRTASLDDLLGRVLDVRKEGGAFVAKLHIDRADIWARVRSGVIRSLSVGYDILSEIETPATKSRARSKLARVHIREASLVVIPADKSAQIRKEIPVTKKIGAVDPAQDDDTDAPTVAQTRTEVRAIMTRACPNDLPLATREADTIIDADGGVAEANARALEILQERTARVPSVRVLNPGPSPADTMQAMGAGFALHYLGVPSEDARARHYAGFSFPEMMRESLETQGYSTRGLNNQRLLEMAFQTRAAAHTGSDFPLTLGVLDVGFNMAVKRAYEAALSALMALCLKLTAADHRTQYRLMLGEFGALAKVLPTGEIKQVTRGEARESWKLDTYAGMHTIGRNEILADAFGLLQPISNDLGQGAAATVANLLVAVLTENGGTGPLMGDGKRLFHVDHGNYDAGGAPIYEGSLSDARVAMLVQRGVNPDNLINVRPDTLVTAPSNLTTAEKIVATLTPATADSVNPFAGKLTVITEPRLEAVNPLGWYLADSRLPPLILGGLAGSEGPQVESRDGWEVLSRSWRVVLDVAAAGNDWRSIYHNVGDAESA